MANGDPEIQALDSDPEGFGEAPKPPSTLDTILNVVKGAGRGVQRIAGDVQKGVASSAAAAVRGGIPPFLRDQAEKSGWLPDTEDFSRMIDDAFAADVHGPKLGTPTADKVLSAVSSGR